MTTPTPRTNKHLAAISHRGMGRQWVRTGFARQLERDLAAARSDIAVAGAALHKLTGELAAAQRARQAAEALAAQNAKDAAMLHRYGAFIIRFDDTDREDEVFVGDGAKDAAMKRWEQISVNWNAHLFRKILGNADATDRHAIADAAIAGEKPQGAST